MKPTPSRQTFELCVLVAAVLVAFTGEAHADCGTDMAQLDQVMKNPTLIPEASKGLRDATCNKVITEAIQQSGLAPAMPAVRPLQSTPPANASGPALGDLSPFKTITADILILVKAGNLPAATKRIKDLETRWDDAARARSPSSWKTVDQGIDRALSELRASKPVAATSAQSLQNLLSLMDATR